MELEPLLTTDDIAAFLKVEVVTIRRLINRGDIPAYRIGGEFRFMRNELMEYLQKQRTTTNIEHREVLEKFTLRARKALDLARDEARNYQHNYVGTEHILLGVLRESDGWIATQALLQQDVDPQKIRLALEAILAKGDTPVGEAEGIGLTPRSKKVVALAGDESRELGHNHVGTEHLLLGVIREGTGIGAGVLEKFGVTLEKTRALVVQQYEALRDTMAIPSVPSEAANLVPADQPALACPRCNARNLPYFHNCFNCGLQLVKSHEKQDGQASA